MAIEIKLQAFEGPLDLLLHLIDKNKVNIYDIPIALITGQYMEYLSAMQEEETQLDSRPRRTRREKRLTPGTSWSASSWSTRCTSICPLS